MRGTIAVSEDAPDKPARARSPVSCRNFRVVVFLPCAVKRDREEQGKKKSAKLEQVLQVTCLFSVARREVFEDMPQSTSFTQLRFAARYPRNNKKKEEERGGHAVRVLFEPPDLS